MRSVRRMLERRPVGRPASRPAVAARPRLESLESRVMLYSASGNLWPHPQLITISFIPDGTNMGGPLSNLFSTFNDPNKPKMNNLQWEAQILKAAQFWAQQTNINFAVVHDDGTSPGSGIYQQGDPAHGDIRIGGYAFGNSTLAMAYQPPPINNFSIAGDIMFNTAMNFNVGTTYDLFTVAAHEIGHALGLNESNATSAAIMYPNYVGVKSVLNGDDISGIQSIYGGARSPDAYDAAGSNGTFATASNLNSLFPAGALTAVVPNLDITTTSDADIYTLNAPSGTTGTLTLTVQSSGLSLLSPNVTVYASDQTTVLGSASGLGQDGTTLKVTIPGMYAGQLFYVKVQGADTTAFGTGAYAMTLNFGNGPQPTVPLPQTMTPEGNPISAGGGMADSLPGHGHHHDGLPHGPMTLGRGGHRGHHHSGHHSV